MTRETHHIKLFRLLKVEEKKHSFLESFVCKLFKIKPVTYSEIEVRIFLDFYKGVCFHDVIRLSNGLRLKVVDKSINPVWVTAVSIEPIAEFNKSEFNPTSLSVIGSALEYC